MQKIRKSDEEWRAVLTPDQYAVARKKATERAFTGKYVESHEPGIYRCVCCGNPVFASASKYDSGSGWPSFTAPAGQESVETHSDGSHFMQRTEVVCARCDAHLTAQAPKACAIASTPARSTSRNRTRSD